MRLKVICSDTGVKVVNAETGEEVENVSAIDYRWEASDNIPILLVEIGCAKSEIEADGVILERGKQS